MLLLPFAQRYAVRIFLAAEAVLFALLLFLGRKGACGWPGGSGSSKQRSRLSGTTPGHVPSNALARAGLSYAFGCVLVLLVTHCPSPYSYLWMGVPLQANFATISHDADLEWLAAMQWPSMENVLARGRVPLCVSVLTTARKERYLLHSLRTLLEKRSDSTASDNIFFRYT